MNKLEYETFRVLIRFEDGRELEKSLEFPNHYTEGMITERIFDTYENVEVVNILD